MRSTAQAVMKGDGTMDGVMTSTALLSPREPVTHTQGWSPTTTGVRPLPAGAHDRDAVTLLMRDGSRLCISLADPLRQAPDLAAALAPAGIRPGTVTLTLDDGSRLMLSTGDILGLHLPPEPSLPAQPALPTQPALPAPAPLAARLPAAAQVRARQAAEAKGNTIVHHVGRTPILQIRDFLAPHAAAELYQYVLNKQADFKPSSVLSNDPEYRKSVVLYRFPEYEKMFHSMLVAALPQLSDTLAVPRFELSTFECQLTATFDKGYFKPHSDNSAAVSHRRITYVYYFHRQPKPFNGGEIRFFDHNPLAPEQPPVRHLLDLAPLQNSIVFFNSGTFHEVRDTICATPEFENSRFTINGWLGVPKQK
jgi:Rps23 Pro-64 3,4-dihydroxylase Tpa1-like proline 4-hydroxylase